MLRYYRALSLIILSWLLQVTSTAQITAYSDKLALQYYEQKEYEKANVYFEKLYDKNADVWFNYYYKSLIGAKEYAKAEKITKKQLKQNKNNVHLHVYLARIYRLEDDLKKEKESYEKSLKDLIAVQPYLQNLAAALMEDKQFDLAIEAYNRGRKATPDYPYFYERAEIYKSKGDLASMINEYLDALEFRPTEIQNVQVNLQNSLGYDDETGGIKNPLLKQELQKRILQHPDKVILSEFLIFIQMQQKDFDGAFVQSRALDKRLKEEGQRIYDLAKICVSNESWSAASRCYEYLISKGTNSIYYDLATIEGLRVEYLMLIQEAQPSQTNLLAIEKKLTAANEKYTQPNLAGLLLKNLANLKAYYLNKPEEAIQLLENYLSRSGLDALVIAEYKIMLADIYLLKGEIWEASLLYSQVEKSFKYEAIGQEAKFKNAKLSFYAGDFTWSKMQADILKGATTKLIANDALDLSLIINDAIGVDTNDAPLKLFAQAELLIFQHRYQEAIQKMDSINQLFSNNTLGDDIYYKKAQISIQLGNFSEAEKMYKNIVEFYPSELYGDDAQFKLAELYDKYLNKTDEAKKAYEQLIVNYPGSIYTVQARKRFRDLRGDNLSN
jgi:tetratricopeptide (TPR) repeat protein